MKTPSNHETDALFSRFGIQRNVRPQGRLELWARCAFRLIREIRAEACSRTGIPWRRCLRAWRHGFRPVYAAVYGLDETDPAFFVPDFAYAYRCYRMNGFWNPIIGNKLVVSDVLSAHGIPHPHVLGIVARGRLIEAGGLAREANAALLDRWTQNGNRVVFRPHWSGGGEGVFFVQRQNRDWQVNSRSATESEVHALVGGLDRYIATSFVEQAEYARRIYPLTTNTLRVLTLIDEDGPFVANVAHRFGTSRSYPIDNFHQGRGGICADVHVSTATLGRALSLDTHHLRSWHDSHPESGSRIEGVPLPGLSRALEGVLAAARCFPEATCVGWDMVITDTGYSLIEANAPPGIVVSQVHAPLLANPRVAGYFRRHGFRVPDGTRPYPCDPQTADREP
ncbi:MAG: sugar-transfer associated ATP-grasp domain-containing protein [Planctomycetia bacterium]